MERGNRHTTPHLRRAALLGALALAALLHPLLPGAAAATVEVALVEPADGSKPFAFEPEEITVKVGDTVRWVQETEAFHTVTSSDSHDKHRPNGKFDHSFPPTVGETWEFTFEEAGSFPYYCQPHAGFMLGTVTVTDGAGGNGDGPGNGDGGDTGETAAPGLVAVAGALVLAALARRRR